MPPKKGGAGAGDGESPFEILMGLYAGRFRSYGLPVYPQFDERMKTFEADDVEFEQVIHHPISQFLTD